VGTANISIERIFDIKTLEHNLDDDIVIFLRGGLIKSIDERQHLVTQPGDVGNVNVIRQVAQEMDGFAANTIIMTVR
jgi:hypothetical protein